MPEIKRYSARNSGHEEDWNDYYEDADGPFYLCEDIDPLLQSYILGATPGDELQRALKIISDHGYYISAREIQADLDRIKAQAGQKRKTEGE